MYYVYYNWQAKPNVGTIHLDTCGHCNSGIGKRQDAVQGINGEWVGPFNTFELAEESIRNINYNIYYDRCVNHQNV